MIIATAAELLRGYDVDIDNGGRMGLKKGTFLGRGPTRESAKVGLRRVLYRRNLDLVRGPFPVRVSQALTWLGVQTVLDVGANVGQYGSAIRSAGFNGRILSCEPLHDAFERLAKRTSSDPGWTALNTAVGARTGSTTINISANSYSSSVLMMTRAHLDAAPGSHTIGMEQVPMTTVAELVRQENIDPDRCLLKIDTQGYESEVLAGADDLLLKFAAVQVELSFVPLYAGQALFESVSGNLTDLGFVLYGLDAGIGDPATRRILQCDGLFVRGDLVDGRGL